MVYHSRLAPTPSGFLHRGNAFNFMLCWLLVRRSGGSLRLRIDDLDAPRMQPAFVQDVFESLAWLGLDFDLGPKDGAEQARFSQQLRLPRYQQLLDQLVARGRVFACTCSRSQLAGLPHYPGTCLHKNIPLDQPEVTWRLNIPEAEARQAVNDLAGPDLVIDLWRALRYPVIRRRDGLSAYHVATLADDMDHGVNLIVRGADLLPSTALHLHLAGLLETREPDYGRFRQIQFYHHPLVTDASGQKLSKSAGASSLKALREAGASSSVLWKELGAWLGVAANGPNDLLQGGWGLPGVQPD